MLADLVCCSIAVPCLGLLIQRLDISDQIGDGLRIGQGLGDGRHLLTFHIRSVRSAPSFLEIAQLTLEIPRVLVRKPRTLLCLQPFSRLHVDHAATTLLRYADDADWDGPEVGG